MQITSTWTDGHMFLNVVGCHIYILFHTQHFILLMASMLSVEGQNHNPVTQSCVHLAG